MIVTELGRHLTRDDIKPISASGRSRAAPSCPSYKTGRAGRGDVGVDRDRARARGDVGGVYCEDCGVSEHHAPWALDPDGARRLWALSEDLVGETLPL